MNARELSIVREWSELVREGRVRVIGLIRQELLSGIEIKSRCEVLREALSAFTDDPLRNEDYEVAAESGNLCRAKEITVSVVDMLICCVALHRDLSVFTTDPDFEGYSRILPLRLHPVRAHLNPSAVALK